VSLTTPEKIRKLQRALYVKAKQEPTRRFHMLYDKVWREDILAYAYARCRANGGAPGVDGETFARIEAYGVERWLTAVREEVRTGRYNPQPVKRVMIPKPGGAGQRPLGVPTIRDRVVQTAAVLVIEPIFEADFDEAAYGYRPQRSALDAVRTVHKAIDDGHTEIIDADLSKYFDTIPHTELMTCVARRISDGKMLHLIRMWLKAPVEETDERGHRRTSGGKKATRGTPQGGVDFIIKYQDRVLFGTDGNPRMDPDTFWLPHFRFFETFDEYFEHPAQIRLAGGSPGHGRWNISGIGLPDQALRKVYYQNALKYLPSLRDSLNRQLAARGLH
jgi:RNA-directed DNA polymerase